MKRNLTCIICPKGCSMEVDISEKGIFVTGNTCPKGEKYAIEECTHPVRTVTSIMRIGNRHDTMVSVKTSVPVAKEHIFQVMEVIHNSVVDAPVHIGDVLIRDVYGADIIATKQIG